MVRRRRATAIAGALALALSASAAWGNGRPPQTNGVVFAPGDTHSMYVRATFGLLVSHDDGCTFDWICDAAFNVGGTYDPHVVVTSDGAILTTSFSGVSVSRDGGCTFQGVSVGTSGRYIDALALGPTGEIWAATSDTVGPGGIFASVDNGATFAARGTVPSAVEWHSLVVAPSAARRVYASGVEAGMAGSDAGLSALPHVEISDDSGSTWAESPLAGVAYASYPAPRVAAVDPGNPDIVYLVSEGANPPSGDLLYRSSDGGMTWTMVLATTQPIHDRIVIIDQQVVVASERGGSFRSADRGITFQPLAGAPQLSCLGLRDDGLLVGCGANWDPDYMAVASSRDGGSTWQKVWRFAQLHGALACPSGTIQHDTCEAMQWDVLRQQFGATGPTCGSNVWPSDRATVTHSGGCCDAQREPGGSLAAIAVVLVAGVRRRRQCATRK